MRYWFDTEFIERGPEHPIRLLSIGIVAEDGREYYYEKPDARELINHDFNVFGDRWLIENARPHLAKDGYHIFGLNDPRQEIISFVGDRPEFWAYFADYDWVALCQIFGRMIDLPKGWPMYCRDLKQEMESRGFKRELLPEQGIAEHSALNDARWTRDAWAAVTQGARA
jgi:hypothetical protein